MDINVRQPYNAISPYKVYSVGYHPERPAWSGDDREYIFFSYPESSVVCLFYEYHALKRARPVRRAYVVTVRGGAHDTGRYVMPGINTTVRCLFAGKGREFDNLRRGAKFLREIDPKSFLLPDCFWYKFAGLVAYEGRERRRKTLLKREVVRFLKENGGKTDESDS
ncbi:MAG: hypothetical protein J5647_03810 [Spirochaetaceae bacterium]|nr:hypothetical protein [Spirochaetaceae bacterium]